jgi:hypothetical protein
MILFDASLRPIQVVALFASQLLDNKPHLGTANPRERGIRCREELVEGPRPRRATPAACAGAERVINCRYSKAARDRHWIRQHRKPYP